MSRPYQFGANTSEFAMDSALEQTGFEPQDPLRSRQVVLRAGIPPEPKRVVLESLFG